MSHKEFVGHFISFHRCYVTFVGHATSYLQEKIWNARVKSEYAFAVHFNRNLCISAHLSSSPIGNSCDSNIMHKIMQIQMQIKSFMQCQPRTSEAITGTGSPKLDSLEFRYRTTISFLAAQTNLTIFL